MNFISENHQPHDIPDLFGDLNGVVSGDEEFEVFPLTETMAHLTVRLGIFPSLSQARKNGHGGEIPWGFNEFRVGKKKFCVWKRRYSSAELEFMWPDEDDIASGC